MGVSWSTCKSRIWSSSGCSGGPNRVSWMSPPRRRFCLLAILGAAVFVQVFGFQLGQDLLGPLVDLRRHAGQPGHVDAVALVGRPVDDLVQEDDVVLPLLDRHVQVLDAGQRAAPGRSVRGSAWRTACGSRCGRAGARRSPRPATCRRRCWCRGRSRPGSPGCARVAVFRMRAVSVISTMNVLWPARQFVAGPDAGEDAVGDADRRFRGPARRSPSAPSA